MKKIRTPKTSVTHDDKQTKSFFTTWRGVTCVIVFDLALLSLSFPLRFDVLSLSFASTDEQTFHEFLSLSFFLSFSESFLFFIAQNRNPVLEFTIGPRGLFDSMHKISELS